MFEIKRRSDGKVMTLADTDWWDGDNRTDLERQIDDCAHNRYAEQAERAARADAAMLARIRKQQGYGLLGRFAIAGFCPIVGTPITLGWLFIIAAMFQSADPWAVFDWWEEVAVLCFLACQIIAWRRTPRELM